MSDQEKRTDQWALDVTNGTEIPSFCPITVAPDGGVEVVVGLTLGCARCPGRLIGVMHADGQAAVDEWIGKNPDWYDRFCNLRDGNWTSKENKDSAEKS